MSDIKSGELVTQLASPHEVVVVSSVYSTTFPDSLFAYLTQPDLLTQWWPKTAKIDPRVGGAYHLAWPEQNWHLRGNYLKFEPGRQIAFTWKWDHDPEDVTMVIAEFQPLENDGTRLTITHGPYAETPEGQERRQGHIEGWQHFLTRLHETLAGPTP